MEPTNQPKQSTSDMTAPEILNSNLGEVINNQSTERNQCDSSRFTYATSATENLDEFNILLNEINQLSESTTAKAASESSGEVISPSKRKEQSSQATSTMMFTIISVEDTSPSNYINVLSESTSVMTLTDDSDSSPSLSPSKTRKQPNESSLTDNLKKIITPSKRKNQPNESISSLTETNVLSDYISPSKKMKQLSESSSIILLDENSDKIIEKSSEINHRGKTASAVLNTEYIEPSVELLPILSSERIDQIIAKFSIKVNPSNETSHLTTCTHFSNVNVKYLRHPRNYFNEGMILKRIAENLPDCAVTEIALRYIQAATCFLLGAQTFEQKRLYKAAISIYVNIFHEIKKISAICKYLSNDKWNPADDVFFILSLRILSILMFKIFVFKQKEVEKSYAYQYRKEKKGNLEDQIELEYNDAYLQTTLDLIAPMDASHVFKSGPAETDESILTITQSPTPQSLPMHKKIHFYYLNKSNAFWIASVHFINKGVHNRFIEYIEIRSRVLEKNSSIPVLVRFVNVTLEVFKRDSIDI